MVISFFVGLLYWNNGAVSEPTGAMERKKQYVWLLMTHGVYIAYRSICAARMYNAMCFFASADLNMVCK